LPYPDANVRLLAFPKGNELVLSAWTIEGTGKLNLKLGQATVTDTFGHSTRTAVSELPLSEFPIYIREIGDPAAVNALNSQAVQAEVARRANGARLEKLRAYLFDFGGTEAVGTLELGSVRRFTPVLAPEVWDPAKGYGFVPEAAKFNSDAKWMADPLNQDSVRLTKGLGFQFTAAPGKYKLRAGMIPVGQSAGLKVTGVLSPAALAFTKTSTTQEIDVTVGNEPVTVTVDDYCELRWLSLVQSG
jgi:hypothetical protein